MNKIEVSDETTEQLINSRDIDDYLWDEIEEVHDEIMED